MTAVGWFLLLELSSSISISPPRLNLFICAVIPPGRLGTAGLGALLTKQVGVLSISCDDEDDVEDVDEDELVDKDEHIKTELVKVLLAVATGYGSSFDCGVESDTFKLKPIGGGLFGMLGGGWFGFSNILAVVAVLVGMEDISLAPLIVFETDVDIVLKSLFFFEENS